jgi:hypothetical protein
MDPAIAENFKKTFNFRPDFSVKNRPTFADNRRHVLERERPTIPTPEDRPQPDIGGDAGIIEAAHFAEELVSVEFVPMESGHVGAPPVEKNSRAPTSDELTVSPKVSIFYEPLG